MEPWGRVFHCKGNIFRILGEIFTPRLELEGNLGEHFSASALKTFPSVPFFLPWLQKPFTHCPFFILDNLGKTKLYLKHFF